MAEAIRSRRLRLWTLDAAFLRASLSGDRDRAERLLGVSLPPAWPYEPDVLRVRLDQLERSPDCAPWLTRAMELASARRVVGVIGFHGPPGGEWLDELAPGGVEFGYTVFEGWRRRGLAFEASRALMDWATRQHGVESFVLSIQRHNRASVGVARKLGFSKVGTWQHEVRGPEDVYRLRVEAPEAAI